MDANGFPFGFRIVGGPENPRKRVEWRAAFEAYAAADERAAVHEGGFLSAFTFPEAFRDHLAETRSTKGYAGPCAAPWLWFDVDREPEAGGLEAALADTRRLCSKLPDLYGVAEDGLLVFLSGSKGFHVGLPTFGFGVPAGLGVHRAAGTFVEATAKRCQVRVDLTIFDRVRAFRAPNARHPKTGLHKRRFTVEELLRLPLEKLLEMAREPVAFELPGSGAMRCGPELPAAWNEAERAAAAAEASSNAFRAALRSGEGTPELSRSTRDFIREGCAEGERHSRLYSAAANMGEFGSVRALALALLRPRGEDLGLSPRDTRAAIENGLASSHPAIQAIREVAPEFEIESVMLAPVDQFRQVADLIRAGHATEAEAAFLEMMGRAAAREAA
jgi:hypothetical protein